VTIFSSCVPSDTVEEETLQNKYPISDSIEKIPSNAMKTKDSFIYEI
jgi:hypothetical protein